MVDSPDPALPRIAVVGSCITRDLWPIRGGGAGNLLYVSRTSLPSLLSTPVAGFTPAREPPNGLRQHQHAACVADLQKTALARLLAFRPSHVIFDFIDERFDLLAAGASLVTHSAELAQSGYLSQPAFRETRRIPRLSDACWRLWRDSASEFAAITRASTLSGAALILHSARWATHQRDAAGALTPIRDVAILEPAEIAPHNALLAQYENEFTALMPPMARIDAGGMRVADPEHPWGLSPFHYVPEYYAEVRRQLGALGLEAAFSDATAAPSAPAA